MLKLIKTLYASATNFAKSFFAKPAHAVSTGSVFGLLVSSAAANAAASGVPATSTLSPAIGPALTSMQADFFSLIGLAYPIMISIAAAMVIFGLAKMFIHKAAGK